LETLVIVSKELIRINIEMTTSLIFDIGANIGNYTLANLTEQTKIVSVEASPKTFKRLYSNLDKYDNVILENIAISNSDKSFITFYECNEYDTLSTMDKSWLVSNNSRFGSYQKTIYETVVPTMSLDALIVKYGVPDLLKIDVEGAEEQVVKSLSQKVPLLCFEWASEWREQNKKTIDYLVYLGFTEFFLQMEDNYTFRPTDFFTSEQIKSMVDLTTDKKEWGMIWAR